MTLETPLAWFGSYGDTVITLFTCQTCQTIPFLSNQVILVIFGQFGHIWKSLSLKSCIVQSKTKLFETFSHGIPRFLD